MPYQLTTRSSRGYQALIDADPQLGALVDAVMLSELPAGVTTWAVGDVLRDRAGQEAEESAGRTRAGWRESPHNYAPALAVDLYPVGADGRVLDAQAGAAGYALIAAQAAALGLGGGYQWGWDLGHVQVSDWHDRVRASRPAQAGGSLGMLLMALWMIWAARRG